MPRVSIGLPVFNGERYLSAALESFLAQTFTDLEVVVCDNASTDRTGEIARDFAGRDARVRYMRNPSNIGANRNYNRAIELARGTYFKLGSDDDLLEPGYIEKMTAVLDADPAISIAHSAIRYIDDDGVPLIYDVARGHYVDRGGRISIEPPDANCATAEDPVARFHAVLRQSVTSHFAMGLLRMSVLRRSAGFGLYYSADRAFLAEMALYGRFADTPEVLFHKREHSHNSRSLTPEQRRQWAGQLQASRGAEYRHLLRVIGRSPLSPWDKLRCLAIGAGKVVAQRARGYLGRAREDDRR